MAAETVGAKSARVINLADHRKTAPRQTVWANDIEWLALYAESLITNYRAEIARIKLDCHERGLFAWWDGPPEMRERMDRARDDFDLYRAALLHMARIAAPTRGKAQLKRITIPKMWLRGTCEGEFYEALRAGCIADDHLFPKSQKMGKGAGNG